MLVGAFSLLCITGYGRAGLASFTEKSRYLYLLIALALPALGVAVDTVMLRWRRLAPVVVVVLLVGVPANINTIVNYMDKPVVQSQRAYRRMMISLPRVAAAKEVPRDTIPEQEFAHFVTIGWLLDSAAAGRVPNPKHISPADEATDTIRLSFHQDRAPQRIPPGWGCGDLGQGSLLFDLHPGDRFLVRAQGRSAEFIPATLAPGEAYRYYAVTVAGAMFKVQRPVSFRVISVGNAISSVCAKRDFVIAARAAAGR